MSERDVINTAIAEAGSNDAGLTAVLYTILNRSNRDGHTPSQVVKQRNQYEGYSAPGPGSVRNQNDPSIRAKAERIWQQVQAGSVADPTNGGFDFRAASAAKGLSAPHGTVDIGGNRFAKGIGSPQTALSAINAVAPIPQPRPTSALGYEPPAMPKVRAISVNPNGSAVQPQMVLPQAAMYGINRLDPNHVTHAPTDFTTQDVGVPEARLSQLSAPFPQPANAFAGSRVSGGPTPSGPVTRSVQTTPIRVSMADQLGSGPHQEGFDLIQRALAEGARPAVPTPPKVTGGDNLLTSRPPSSFQQNNLDALGFLSALTGAGSGGGAMRAVAALNAQPAPSPYVPPVGNPFHSGGGPFIPSPSQTGRPTAAQLAAINDVSVPHTAVPNQTRIGATPSPVLAFNGDQNTGIPSIAAIKAATPTAPAFNAGTWGSAGLTAPGSIKIGPDGNQYQYVQMTGGNNGTGNATYQWTRMGTPTVPRPPGPGLMPLTKFNTVNPGSQIVPRMQSGFNSTGLGHILQAANGEPIQGGLLGMLFNPGGLLARNATPQVPSPPIPLPALLAQQSPDQRGPAALLASNMIDSSGMVTGSGGHSLWGSH